MLNAYMFYKEYSDGQAIITSYERPDEVVMGVNVGEAVDKFLKKSKLQQEEFDNLSDHEWRLFTGKKKFLGEHVSAVFYIKQRE